MHFQPLFAVYNKWFKIMRHVPLQKMKKVKKLKKTETPKFGDGEKHYWPKVWPFFLFFSSSEVAHGALS
jgi:hypothetical protein